MTNRDRADASISEPAAKSSTALNKSNSPEETFLRGMSNVPSLPKISAGQFGGGEHAMGFVVRPN